MSLETLLMASTVVTKLVELMDAEQRADAAVELRALIEFYPEPHNVQLLERLADLVENYRPEVG
jgi:hypothetical protein